MADINSWTFSGRLTKDAEQKENVGSNGSTVTTFTVANNTGFGQNKSCTFVTVNAWGKLGLGLFPYLVKGKPVAVTGPMTTNKWLGQDGNSHTDIIVNAKDIQLLNGGDRQSPDSSADEATW